MKTIKLVLENVSYVYNPGTIYETVGITDADLSFESEKSYAVIGHTGSGKSTLLQLMNGLLSPAKGRVLLDGEDVHAKKYKIKKLRSSVGLVFQYPEYQLFEETVIKDVCFGPKNLGYTPEECMELAKEALRLVGIEEDKFDQNPFNLSGGQKRRAAIAGVLAMNPGILVLDEPAAGLDPEGKEQILNLLKTLRETKKMGIVMVSHNMDDAAGADEVIVLDKGSIALKGSAREVFKEYEKLNRLGLDVPFAMRMTRLLRSKGIALPDCFDNEELSKALLKMYKR